MNKGDFKTKFANRAGVSLVEADRTYEIIVDLLQGHVRECLDENKNGVLFNLFSIKPKVAAARTFRNPANGGEVEVPERVVLKVKPLVSFMKHLGLK